MFANTLTLTVNGTPRTLTRVNQDNYGSEYKVKNSVEAISMKIRHSTDNQGGRRFARHNVYVEWVLYGTPTSVEQVYTFGYTIRDLEQSDPAGAKDLALGMSTLIDEILDGLVVGEN